MFKQIIHIITLQYQNTANSKMMFMFFRFNHHCGNEIPRIQGCRGIGVRGAARHGTEILPHAFAHAIEVLIFPTRLVLLALTTSNCVKMVASYPRI